MYRDPSISSRANKDHCPITIRIVVILALAFFPACSRSQGRVYISGTFEFGNLSRANLDRNPHLGSGWNDYTDKTVPYNQTNVKYVPTFAVDLHYRLTSQFAVTLGWQAYELDVEVYDATFQNLHPDAPDHPSYYRRLAEANQGNFEWSGWYGGPTIATHYGFGKLSRETGFGFYSSAGVSYNYHLSSHTTVPLSYFYESDKENLKMTSTFRTGYLSPFIELGIGGYPRGSRRFFSLYLKYYFAGSVIHGEYQNTREGKILYSDRFDFSGNYFTGGFKYGRSLRSKDERFNYRLSKTHHQQFRNTHKKRFRNPKSQKQPPAQSGKDNTRGF